MGIWGHGWKKGITVGVLVVFIWPGMAWASEAPAAAPPDVKSIQVKDFLELASAALLEEKKKDLIGLGVSASGITVVSVDLSGDDLKKLVNNNAAFIETLMKYGIFVADSKWHVWNNSRFQEFNGCSYVSLYGVVFEINRDKHIISVMNLTEKKFKDITATLTNKDNSISLETVDIDVFMRLFAAVGIKDASRLADVRIFLKDNFGIGLSENGLLIEDAVQYLRAYDQQGNEGLMMVTGQGYNVAQVGNKWYFGKSFDLVDAKTLLTDPQYSAMAKEILTNTKLFAQTVLNVVGSWIEHYSPKDLTGASKDIMDLLNYDASKLPRNGVELRLNNGNVDLVPRQ